VTPDRPNRRALIGDIPKKAKHYDITSRLYPVPAIPSGRNASGRTWRRPSPG